MKRALILSTVLLFAAATAFASGPGPCGDIDDDVFDQITLSDMAVFTDYMFISGFPPMSLADADCDGKEGVTIGDYLAFVGYFAGAGVTLDCSASGRYDYTLIPEDTIIMPMARCIKQSENSVTLDIEIRLHTPNAYVYLPFDPMAAGSSGNFVLSSTTGPVQTDPSGVPVIYTSGSGTLFVQLHYTRVGAGMGEIHTGLIDINTFRRYAVVTGLWYGSIDLRRPVTLNCWQIDYPVGDLDCDCQASLGDLTLMVDGLFISLTWPSPCPCGF